MSAQREMLSRKNFNKVSFNCSITTDLQFDKGHDITFIVHTNQQFTVRD
jgi:hypothetical protein